MSTNAQVALTAATHVVSSVMGAGGRSAMPFEIEIQNYASKFKVWLDERDRLDATAQVIAVKGTLEQRVEALESAVAHTVDAE